MDRELVLSQISDRRRLANQRQNAERQAQMQSALLAQEMQAARDDRDQEATLAREQMRQQREMAAAAESALDKRLSGQFEREQAAIREQNLSVIDEEETLAGGIAKRVNDQLAALGKPPTDPIKLEEWTKNWSRIRSQVPTNLESGLIEEGGRWKVNPDYFRLRRARWMKPSNTNAIAAALGGQVRDIAGPTDESIVRQMTNNRSLIGQGDPVAAAISQMASGVPGVSAQVQSPALPIARSPSVGYQPQTGFVPGFGGVGMGAPVSGGSIAQSRASIMDALARLFSNARWGAAPMMTPTYAAPFVPQSVGRFDFIAGE